MNQKTIANLESISRADDRYFARYEWEETREVSFALPVYTNVRNMTGKINSSRTLKKISTAQKTRTESQKIEITIDEAREFVGAAKMTGMIERVERFNDTEWIVRIK